MSLLARAVSNVSWSLCFKFGGLLAAFGANVILARVLAPEEMGVFLVTSSLALFMSLLARIGMKQYLVRLLGNALTEDRGTACVALIRRSGVMIVCSTIVICLCLSNCRVYRKGVSNRKYRCQCWRPRYFKGLYRWILFNCKVCDRSRSVSFDLFSAH